MSIEIKVPDMGESIVEATIIQWMKQEGDSVAAGEAVAGMILNGLGFANRPLSLTPQFFANKPLDLLFRPGVRAEMFNRFKLGRTLDAIQAYGCDLLLSELALAGRLFLPFPLSILKRKLPTMSKAVPVSTPAHSIFSRAFI